MASGLGRRSVIIGGGALGLAALGTAVWRGGGGRSDRFTAVVNQNPPLLDIAKAGNYTNILRPTIDNVVETLVEKNSNGDIVPGLCDWTMSPDTKIVEYRLRPGVRFHNGMEVTTRDIVFSHERMMRFSPTYRSRGREIAHIEVLDPQRVRFHFRTSGNIYVRTRGTYVFSSAYHAQVGEERFSEWPIGTGPYKLNRFVDSQYADLDRFDGYWGPRPQIERARIVFVTEDMTRVAMLRSGEADLVMAVPFPMVPMLEGMGFGKATADVHPTISVRFQLINPATPWADRRVRLAIAHAIDAEAIINGLFGGVPRHFAVFSPAEDGFDPAIRPYSYDPARARQLLAEAGYPNGFEMPLTYFTNAYYGLRETTEVVSLYLRRVGITTPTTSIDAAKTVEFVRGIARDRNARVVTISAAILASSTDPADAMHFGYASSAPQSWYRNPTLDGFIDAASVASDPARRIAALRSCARIIHDDLPLIPLWNNVIIYMMRPGIAFHPTQRDTPLMLLKNLRVA